MTRVLTCIVLAISLAAMAMPAESRGRAKDRAGWQPPPVKDCTRINARYGYYGNPWCSPAEQQAWDRAEARRLAR